MATSFYYKSTADVQQVINNYKRNIHLPVVTESGRISFEKLDAFLAEARYFVGPNGEVPNGLSIHLFRELIDPAKHKIYDSGRMENLCEAEKDSKFSQVSFLIVPALFDDEEYVTDLLNGSNQIPVLHPGGEATGLCPPRCK